MTFDIVIYLIMVVAIIAGFRAGIIRSSATILGYMSAAPIAVVVAAFITKGLSGGADMPAVPKSAIFVSVFISIGFILGALLRFSIAEAIGPTRIFIDRFLGAVLGGCRIALVAVTLVMVFDRIIPPGHEPGYLIGSKLKPILLRAGKSGLRSLPPEMVTYLDQLKRT